MGELVFIGLGLHDAEGVTLRGREEARGCDVVFAEFYTSTLAGLDEGGLRELAGKDVRILSRAEVEEGRTVLEAAADRRVAFLVAGDPMAATTHVDLRLRAAAAGIPTRIVHGVSILTAAAGAVGLQAYKFGRTTTVPYPTESFRPTSPAETVAQNRSAGLHSLVLLDLREDGGFLGPRRALDGLLEAASAIHSDQIGSDTVVVVLSRVGSPDERAVAGPIRRLRDRDLGPPPHCLIIPGPLHFLEREALERFAGLPHDAET